MRRALLVVALAFGVLVLAPGPAMACQCASASLQELVDRADSVADGRVDWVTHGPDQTSYGVHFGTVYKGELAQTEKVVTNPDGASCGATDLAVKERYLFFLDGVHRGVISTNLCNQPLAYSPQSADEIETLTGHADAPLDSGTVESPRIWQGVWGLVLGLGAVVLVAGAALTGRRLRQEPP